MRSLAIKNSNSLSYFCINWLSDTDGPGKRLVLFLQGCHLDCSWCHSPHSQPQESPLLYFNSLCKKCRRCENACKNEVHLFNEKNEHIINRDNCTKCGACIEACPQSSGYTSSGSLVLPTKKTSVAHLFNTIKPQLDLLKSAGGITFTGGEPLLQYQALSLLAQKCKDAGINTALETSGIVPLQSIRQIAPSIDTWLIGMRLTTGTNTFGEAYLEKKTRETLAYLSQLPSKKIIVRIPIIPGYTTTEKYLDKVRRILEEHNLKDIEILRHNPESAHYYNALGLPGKIPYNASLANEKYTYVSQFFIN